jgi:hypothetical protein
MVKNCYECLGKEVEEGSVADVEGRISLRSKWREGSGCCCVWMEKVKYVVVGVK